MDFLIGSNVHQISLLRLPQPLLLVYGLLPAPLKMEILVDCLQLLINRTYIKKRVLHWEYSDMADGRCKLVPETSGLKYGMKGI